MPLWNWVGAKYAFCTNLFRIWKGKSTLQKGNVLSSSSQTQSSRGPPEKAVLKSCSLLPRLSCRDLLRLLTVCNSRWLSPTNKVQSIRSPHAKFQAPSQTEREIHYTFVDFFFFIMPTSIYRCDPM